MINQDIIAQDLFYKIRSRFPKMEMGDENGAPTFEATKGRFFDFDAVFEGVNLGTVSISINEPGSLKIYFNRNILENADQIISHTWYSFLREMRKFAMKRLMSFDTRDISKTNLDKRDYGYLAKKESVMSESIMRGTSRTSYKPLDKTKLIIRHSKNVDESIPGARSRNIESLFIENAAGERFKYPFPHKAGAEAMQRHVANGGVPHDPVGQKIIEMSEDIAKLTSFKRYVTREDLMNTGTNDIVERANAKLQSLKETIHKISRQHHYEAFKNACATGSEKDEPLIDEYTMEDYKDKFTVKSFKEDIAEVFPLLYRIMQETSEINLEDVAQPVSTTKELNLDDVVAESPETQFYTWATTLVETSLNPEELSRLQELVSEHFPVGMNGENVSSSLQELGINVTNETKMKLAALAEAEGPDADAKNIVYEFLGQYEPEILSAIGGSPDVSAPLSEGTQHQVVVNGKAVDLNSLEVDGVDTRDYPDFSDAYISYGLFTDGTEMSDQDLEMFTDQYGDIVHELAYDSLHEGQPQSSMEENMDQTPEEKRAAAEYMAKVAQAVRSGQVQPEEVEQEFFDTLPMMGVSDDKVMAAWDRIIGTTHTPRPKMSDADIDAELRGIKSNDDDENDDAFLGKLRRQAKSGSIAPDTTGFGAEVDEASSQSKAGTKQIAEFILGFYDREKGTFPLGETGVAIKVQKEFGDQAGELAKRLIEKLSVRKQDPELESMKVLSGQQKAPQEGNAFGAAVVKGKADGIQPDEKVSVGGKEVALKESVEFTDIQKLAGIIPGKKTTGTSSELLDLKALAGL